jgi:hypothetical protein
MVRKSILKQLKNALKPNVPEKTVYMHVVKTRILEAKTEARTLEAKHKARSLKAEDKDMISYP